MDILGISLSYEDDIVHVFVHDSIPILQELPDVPLFLSLHNLCATLKCTSPSAVLFRSAVLNAGYRISGTHVNPLGMKTNAPMGVIWDIMRCWVRISIYDRSVKYFSDSQGLCSNREMCYFLTYISKLLQN